MSQFSRMHGRCDSDDSEKADELPSLARLLAKVDCAEGREKVKTYLSSQPYPHFEPYGKGQRFLKKIEADGTSTVGRFVNRQFVLKDADSHRDRTTYQAINAVAEVDKKVRPMNF